MLEGDASVSNFFIIIYFLLKNFEKIILIGFNLFSKKI